MNEKNNPKKKRQKCTKCRKPIVKANNCSARLDEQTICVECVRALLERIFG